MPRFETEDQVQLAVAQMAEGRMNKAAEPVDPLTPAEHRYIRRNGGIDDRVPLAKYFHIVPDEQHWA